MMNSATAAMQDRYAALRIPVLMMAGTQDYIVDHRGHNHIPVVHFKKGERKEETARPHLEAASRQGKDRVVLIGVAQEKASIWKSWPRKGQEKARHPHMDWGRETNHFYFYVWDAEWRAAFWKTNAYAPFPIWLWLNGHDWAKRQLEKAGIAYQALDNGFRSCSVAEDL